MQQLLIFTRHNHITQNGPNLKKVGLCPVFPSKMMESLSSSNNFFCMLLMESVNQRDDQSHLEESTGNPITLFINV